MSTTAETIRIRVEKLHPAPVPRVHGIDMRNCGDTLRQVQDLVTPFDPRERRVMHLTALLGTEQPIAA